MAGHVHPRRKFEAPAESFNKCPRGHELPNSIDGLECSAAACAKELNVQVPDVRPSSLQDETYRLEVDANRMLSKEDLRNKLIPIPEGLTGAAADEYAERKYGELLPIAMAELEWQLRFGSDAERAAAAKDVRIATGHGPKDRGGTAANMIVINMGGGGSNGNLPPLPYVGEIVDAATKAMKDTPKALPPNVDA